MTLVTKEASSPKKSLSLVYRRIGNLGMIVILAMVLLVMVDVILRRVFNSPLAFSKELIEIMLVVVVFCSLAYTTFQGRHVSVDVLVSRFPPKAQAIINPATDFLSAVMFALIGWRSIDQAMHIWNIGSETGILRIPYYPFLFVVAFGSISACIALLIGLIHLMIGAARK